ncbi:MAG: Panacea domain-containing protein [Agrococcus casei]|uniref:Panacea domain-containing protein n=1 Tax=Agrococcus casei TaxID=343512 RepID=UPI003F908480
MTNAIKVAEYLRTKSVYGKMQLQKLLYYSQAWSLAWTGSALFTDEIEAWKDGPVVRQVWAAGQHDDFVVPSDGEMLSAHDKAIIDAVYAFYGNQGGAVLSTRTHRETPWLEARADTPAGGRSTNPISQSTMRRYFSLASIGGEKVPIAPTMTTVAADEQFAAAKARQASRWRGALDALALR